MTQDENRKLFQRTYSSFAQGNILPIMSQPIVNSFQSFEIQEKKKNIEKIKFQQLIDEEEEEEETDEIGFKKKEVSNFSFENIIDNKSNLNQTEAISEIDQISILPFYPVCFKID